MALWRHVYLQLPPRVGGTSARPMHPQLVCPRFYCQRWTEVRQRELERALEREREERERGRERLARSREERERERARRAADRGPAYK